MSRLSRLSCIFKAFVLPAVVLVASVTFAAAGDFADANIHQQLADVAAAPATVDELAAATVDELVAEASAESDFNDPIEPFNRLMFDLNEGLQDVLLRPVSTLYNKLPAGFRDAFGNVLHNLRTPIILANDILQFEPERAMTTVSRFLINTTVGVGGFYDAAEDMGIATHDEDFGQTLGTWGVGEGFYLVLPLFGPSSPRDAVGKLFVDGFFDPMSMYLKNTGRDEEYWSSVAVGAVSEYSSVVDELNQIKSTSIDYYAAIRSMYRQKRKAEISNGQEIDLPPIPDLDLSMKFEDAGDSTASISE